jgi:hypothetical protein
METFNKWREIFGWERGGEVGGGLCNHAQFTSFIAFRRCRDSPPNPVCEYKTHRYAAVLEQPRFFGNATKELSDELFTRNGLGYMGDKVQLRVYFFPRRNININIPAFQQIRICVPVEATARHNSDAGIRSGKRTEVL